MKTKSGALAATLFASLGALALAATAATPKPVAKAPVKRNMTAAVTLTPESGYLRGNPAAPVKLVVFSSYTCPHCAHFEVDADAQLQLGFIGNGKGSVEVRSFYRNPIDVAATLLATCGGTAKFYGNHTAILRSQAKWLRNPSQAEAQRWNNPDFATRMRAISRDLGLYKLMEARGYTPAQLDKCLADKPLAERIANQSAIDSEKYKIPGTPSFLVNGELQESVHDWASLRPKLQALTK